MEQHMSVTDQMLSVNIKCNGILQYLRIKLNAAFSQASTDIMCWA
jgi:hypothetical protein